MDAGDVFPSRVGTFDALAAHEVPAEPEVDLVLLRIERLDDDAFFERFGVHRSAWDAPPATSAEIQAGLDAVTEYHAEFGAFTDDERAETDALLDRLLGPRSPDVR